MHRTRISIGALMLAGGALVATTGPAQAAPTTQHGVQASVPAASTDTTPNASTDTTPDASTDPALDTDPGTGVDPDIGRPKVAAPEHITVHEVNDGTVTISWDAVRGVNDYRLHAYKIDPTLSGPYPFNVVSGSQYTTTTRKTYNTFVDNFAPRTDRDRLMALPWTITVASLSPDSKHRDSSAHAPSLLIQSKIVYSTVEITQNPSAGHLAHEKNVVKDCATLGLAATVGTAAGGGVIALASVWIPGVNAVTFTGVAAASAAAGVSAIFGCIVKNVVNPDGATISPGLGVAAV